MVIRELSQQDIFSFLLVFQKVMLEEFPEYTPTTREYLAREDNGRSQFTKMVWGAFVSKRLVGFMVVSNPYGGIMFIPWIAVLKEYQKKGVGTRLLKKADQIAKSKGAHSIHLETYERNIGYYKHLGYEVYGFDKKGYFGTDNYLLKKPIQEPREENYLKD